MVNSPNRRMYRSISASVITSPNEAFGKSTNHGRNRRINRCVFLIINPPFYHFRHSAPLQFLYHFEILAPLPLLPFLPFSWPRRLGRFSILAKLPAYHFPFYRSSALTVLPFSDFIYHSDFTVLPTLPFFAPLTDLSFYRA